MTRKIVLVLLGITGVLLMVIIGRTLLLPSPARTTSATANQRIDEETSVSHLSAAIRFATESVSQEGPVSGAAFDSLNAFTAAAYPRIAERLKREEVNRYSVLYTWQGSEPDLPAILFLAHLDVVPVESDSAALWTHAPYSGDVADGYIWGRGTLDDKGQSIALLEATEILAKEGWSPRRTIYLAFGHDEELGGVNGAGAIAALLKSRGVKLTDTFDEGSYVVRGVVPGISQPVALIGIAEKGYLTLRLSVSAPGGHSSIPGRNEAITRLARAIGRLEDQPMPASLGGAVSPMFDALAPKMPFMQRAIFANRWLFAPLLVKALENEPATNALIRTTTAVTMIEGGVKENVLPREAAVTLNFRIRPGDTIEGLVTHVHEAINDPDIRIEKIGENNDPLPVSSTRTSAFAALRAGIEAVYPDAVIAPALVIAGTDTPHYAPLAQNSYRFEPVRLDASDIERIHGVNERIAVKDFIAMVRFYAIVMRSAAG
jgi:carboxypeptidase PM20D1